MELLSLITDVVPRTKNLLDYKQYFHLIQFVPQFAQSKLQPIVLFYKYPKDTIVGIYDRLAFNTYGDAFVHWNLPGENPKPYPVITGKFNDDILKTLIDFKNSVYQKKAKLYITFPGYQYSSYENCITAIKQVEQQLRDNKFVLISTPEEYIMPDSLIFDTPYHLIKKGVDYRTELLIKDLKKVVKR